DAAAKFLCGGGVQRQQPQRTRYDENAMHHGGESITGAMRSQGGMATIVAAKPLVDGHRLTVEEFLRRWEEQPGLRLAERVEGVVPAPSPVGSAPAWHRALTALYSNAGEWRVRQAHKCPQTGRPYFKYLAGILKETPA